MWSRHSESEGGCSYLCWLSSQFAAIHPPPIWIHSNRRFLFRDSGLGQGLQKNSTHICCRFLSRLGWKFDNPGKLGGDSGMNASDNGRTESASELPYSIHQHQVNHITRGQTSQSGVIVSPTPLEGDFTGASGRFPISS